MKKALYHQLSEKCKWNHMMGYCKTLLKIASWKLAIVSADGDRKQQKSLFYYREEEISTTTLENWFVVTNKSVHV
jgi:hypothetical protein